MKPKNYANSRLTRFLLSIPLLFIFAAVIGLITNNWLFAATALVLICFPFQATLCSGPFGDKPRYIGSYKPIVLNGEFSPQTFVDMVKQLRDQINSMLAGLPPLEQFETASDLSYGLRALQNSAANLIDLAAGLEDAVKQYASKLSTDAEQGAEAKLIEKGEYVKKADSEAAVKSAAEAKEKEVKESIETASKEKERVTAARGKLVADKVCTEAAATALKDDFFKEDGYTDRVAKLTARLKTLADNKINHSEAFVAEMVAIPLDAEGDKTFEARVNSVKGLVASSASRGTETPVKPPLAIPGVEGATGAPVLCF